MEEDKNVVLLKMEDYLKLMQNSLILDVVKRYLNVTNDSYFDQNALRAIVDATEQKE